MDPWRNNPVHTLPSEQPLPSALLLFLIITVSSEAVPQLGDQEGLARCPACVTDSLEGQLCIPGHEHS
jgi:hypothetical protein